MTFVERYRLLRDACLEAQEQGWKIVAGTYGRGDDKTCCPIGALNMALGSPCLADDRASDALGFSGDDEDRFVVAVDRRPCVGWSTAHSAAYSLGQCLRAEFIDP